MVSYKINLDIPSIVSSESNVIRAVLGQNGFGDLEIDEKVMVVS